MQRYFYCPAHKLSKKYYWDKKTNPSLTHKLGNCPLLRPDTHPGLVLKMAPLYQHTQ